MEDKFDTTMEVLEIGRDESKTLTEDEKRVLTEAHCIVQTMQQMDEEEIEKMEQYL